MWNYNLDEMPKDGSKIIGFFKDKNYESTEVFYYDADDWRRVSHCLPVSTRYLQCWALAPEEPENDGVEKLIDWFDYVFPSIAKDYSVPYWTGLRAIRDRIDFKINPE